MKLSYQRSPLKSYMVIRGEEKDIGYQEQMLQENAIPLLLPFYAIVVNMELEVWYDITGQRSLRDVIRQEGVTLENLRRMIEGLTQAFYKLQQYLIRQEDVYMNPDTVYFDRNHPNQISLCFCPVVHPDTQQQIYELMEFLVGQVDHNQKKVTQLCYELYEIAQDPVSMEQLAEKVRAVYDMEGEGEGTADRSGAPSIPSEERSIVIRENYQPDADRNDPADFSPVKNLTPEQEDVGAKGRKTKKIKAKWEELLRKGKEECKVQFPLLSKLAFSRRKKGKKEDEYGVSEDFVFDPQEVLQQKTQLLHTKKEKEMESRTLQQGEAKLVYDGNGCESNYILDKNSFSIGSLAGENDAILHSDVVSRHHARIVKQEEGYYLEDLNSTNGTYLNGDLLPYNVKVLLHSMDQIMFADVTYHFV